ncbi:MAG: L,D-transpeptidase family protein [Hyphomicrobium sp.]
MGRLRCAALSVLALTVICPAAFAADPAPATASDVPVQTGSIGGTDAAIGAAARRLIEPAPVADGAHLSPAATISTGADAQPAAAPPKPTPEELDRTALSTFYQARGDEPLWVTADGYTAKARLTLAELSRAGSWGLDPADFKVPDLAGAPTPEALAEAESGLSLAVMAYARHARGGKIAKPAEQLSSYFDRRPQWKDRTELLSELAKTDDPAQVLVDLHPKHPQFTLLRQAWLETLRAKSARGAKLPAGSDLKPGESHADVEALRQRLAVAAADGTSVQFYDDQLAEAVRGLQALKGLASDGVLTAETRTKLNQPIKGNTDQLAANMQMWRYIPADLGDMHVMLNVPEYEIRILKSGEEVFHERVTVGLVNKQTPIFSDQIELVTFKSRWRVPDSIKVREIWPSLLSGGGMMRQHGLEMRRLDNEELVDWRKIDWSKTPMADYVVWQPPGRINQLGIVKFSFPNKHYVFMHDTPDKHMFAWTRRANSHGCMRIRNPLKMAEVILAADKAWDRAKIDDLVKNGPDHNLVPLDKKIPVHIVYFTARVEEGGKITTFGDIYGHEKRFALALKGQWNKIKVGPDHLAPVDETKPPVVAQRKAPKGKNDDSVLSLVNSALGSGF